MTDTHKLEDVEDMKSSSQAKNRKNIEIHLCISQLYYYAVHDIKVHEELCYTLQQYDLEEIEFYLPQICSIIAYLKDRSSSLAHFILEQCSKSIHFALKTRMLLRTMLCNDEEHHFHDLDHQCIRAAITGKSPQDVDHLSGDDDEDTVNHDGEYEKKKSKRFRYLKSMLNFIKDLCAIEKELIELNQEDRPSQLRSILKSFNRKILESRVKTDSEWRPGLYLPLSTVNDQHYTIVRIPEHEAIVLKSKRHTPLMLYFEVIPSGMTCGDPELESLEENYANVLSSFNPKMIKDEAGILRENSLVLTDSSGEIEGDMEMNGVDYKNASGDAEDECEIESHEEHTHNVQGTSNLTMNVEKLTKEPQNLNQTFQCELWSAKIKRIKKHSPFGHIKGWRLEGAIVKYGSDCLQEQVALQLTQQFSSIFKESNLPLYLFTYHIVTLDANSCLMQPVSDTLSIHQLKKFNNKMSLKDYFEKKYSKDSNSLNIAKQNFAESLAAYSLVCYFLQLKDRNNGNILVDNEGHIIHIDWGFVLWNTPGSLGFEVAPFKITQEYLDLLGGRETPLFRYFETLFKAGFKVARCHFNKIYDLVEIILNGSPKERVPFVEGKDLVLANLKARFFIDLPDEECTKRIEDLINQGCQSWTTSQYDQFQFYSTGTLY